MNKNSKLIKFIKFVITFFIVVIAIFLALKLWHNYMNNPWTRDGRIRADTIMISPDVSGLVEKVYVKDNQLVKKGELIFQIDKKRFLEDVAKYATLFEIQKSEYQMKKKQFDRRFKVNNDVISKEEHETATYQLEIAKANYDKALVELNIAKLNLERSSVKASEDGWVTNLVLKNGDYINKGENSLALIINNSFWIYGYFEEHKIPLIKEGDIANIQPLGTDFIIKGHVESIANGITDRDNDFGKRLLANVNPSFTWVRLAQRIPVRIHIDEVPEGFILRAGVTCTIKIIQNK
ncbi:putative fusaric acid resistance efflux pump, membrane fusion protein [Arcobacter venerupis]|uniref:Fusaric acid resistance efflux pump, membrane fusion protein n=1 Tax=Arcobacter venerupis TaxID=1054033 RepID=A0AAE7BAC3_9BACT|nr:biotin/lipoyl-binding protein [Arcobacter venerupis]QKF68249.1 putative fusaric acid resistance efflux pump, membrane fusion protein [Arcobacter venerupis]RWS48632.1 efflux transporter periplasmic adaptor subunit [Arcobacter venerupis]